MNKDQYGSIAIPYHAENEKVAQLNNRRNLERTVVEGSKLQSFEGLNVLDIGCGTGIHMEYLVATHPEIRSVRAIDISREMIEVAKRESHSTKIKYLTASMDDLPFADNSFDYIFSRYSLHYSNNIQVTLNEAARVLKNGAVFYFRVTHPVYGLLLKRGKDYMLKEDLTFSIQGGNIQVVHPTFTFEEYVNAIVSSGMKITELHEEVGPASHENGYTVPTVLAFLLTK